MESPSHSAYCLHLVHRTKNGFQCSLSSDPAASKAAIDFIIRFCIDLRCSRPAIDERCYRFAEWVPKATEARADDS